MRAPRVLFVLEYFPPHVGGVESLFANLTRGLADAGYAVTVITLHLPGSPTRETVNGVDVIRVRTPQTARRYLFMLLALPLVLRHAWRADLIHTTTYNAALPAWIAATLWHKPSVLVVHEVFGPQWNDLMGLHPLVGYGFRVFEWCVLRLPFTRYICVSAHTRVRLLRYVGVRPERAVVIHPALDYTFWDAQRHAQQDLRQLCGVPAGTFLALYSGRPGLSKGVEYLIDAAPRVHAALPESHIMLILARDPLDHYDRLRQQIVTLGLSDYITVRDPVPREDVPGYWLGADCVVVPSVSEGFGYAAVEAATLGCTVIATSGHSVEEVIGESVILVPPRDAAALADAIVSAAHARAAQPPPRQFTLTEHIARVRALYARLLPRNVAEGCNGVAEGSGEAAAVSQGREG